MTTLQPRSPYTAEELVRLYPQDLELRQVQILLRHGERTPVNARFKNTGLAPNWPYCDSINRLRSVVQEVDGSFKTLKWARKLESFAEGDQPKLNRGPNREQDSICLPGELTSRGRETTLALGSRIRRLYVDQLGFLPGFLDVNSMRNVYLRSTPIPRARESVEQAFTGLYPPQAREQELPPIAIVTRNMPDETLFPNEGACKRFAELAAVFADRTAQLYNSGPELAYINKKIGKWMPAESPVVKVDSHPRLSGIMDTINATLAHGSKTRLPAEFYDQKVLDNIDKICREEWFVGYLESNEYRRLGIGAAVGDITQRMVERVKGGDVAENSPFKISMAGCHDTTLAAVLAALGVYDLAQDRWPNFTSNIAFELFKTKSSDKNASAAITSPTGAVWPSKEKTWWSSLFSSTTQSEPTIARTPMKELNEHEKTKFDGYYVRLRYNDKPLTLPFCRLAGRHFRDDESFCSLAAFKEAADSFTPKSWVRECGMNLGKPTTSRPIERPPGL